MISQISEGVEVSVETFYQPDYSNPLKSEHMFAYRITIDNYNDYPIQLMDRTWYIFDSTGEYKFVAGEGVLGQQPIIPAHTYFQYVSRCSLHSDIGNMEGFYGVINMKTKNKIEVKIPKFELFVPHKFN